MIYRIHKKLVLLKNHLNNLKDSIFRCFFQEYDKLLFIFFFKKSQHIMIETLSLEEENIIKDLRNLFRLKNKLNFTAIKI